LTESIAVSLAEKSFYFKGFEQILKYKAKKKGVLEGLI